LVWSAVSLDYISHHAFCEPAAAPLAAFSSTL
jgi:hypothetical protein